MAKCFLFRHQQAGVVTTHVFLNPPSPEQMEAMHAQVRKRHAKPGWVRAEEAILIMEAKLPVFPAEAVQLETLSAAPPEFFATGTVAPPVEKRKKFLGLF